MKILLVDNYDSFTYNLKHLFTKNGIAVEVRRNDNIDFGILDDYQAIVLSPGPSIPENAGDLKKLIRQTISTKPILGICLGMQAIGEILGSPLQLMAAPIHGKSTSISHNNDPLFDEVPVNFKAGRYHSWIINSDKKNEHFKVISVDKQNRIMAIKHNDKPVYGLQFHPESILTPEGDQIIQNFIKIFKPEL